MITHRSVLYEVAAGERVGSITRGSAGCPTCRWRTSPSACSASTSRSCTAGHVHFCPDAKQLIAAVGAVRPTAFFGVPRVWEKIQAGIQALLAAEQDEARRAAVARPWTPAGGTWRAASSAAAPRLTWPPRSGRRTRQVLGPIRALLGLGEARARGQRGGPAAPDVAAFFAGLGMKILDVYGMTETTGAFTVQHHGRVQARHGRPAAARHRGAHRARRRDAGPAAR